MRRYKVERIDNEMVVHPNRMGKYRATTAEEIKEALTIPKFKTTTAEVLIGNRWETLGRPLRRL